MEFLIDKTFWDNLVKKAPPVMALQIQNGLKKNRFGISDLKENCVLKLPKKIISFGFCKALINLGHNDYGFYRNEYIWRDRLLSNKRRNIKKISSFEKLILEVLIETQGLSEKIKYKDLGADQGELVKIFPSEQTPPMELAELQERTAYKTDANDQNNQISSKENNLVLEIERLADLRERGLLTDQEFTIAKRKLLS